MDIYLLLFYFTRNSGRILEAEDFIFFKANLLLKDAGNDPVKRILQELQVGLAAL